MSSPSVAGSVCSGAQTRPLEGDGGVGNGCLQCTELLSGANVRLKLDYLQFYFRTRFGDAFL